MFHLRKIPKSVALSCRLLSSLKVEPLVGITVDDEGIATLQLKRAPVNSLNLEFLQVLYNSICEVEKNKCKGMVLTSASPTIFSAGLDLNEFFKPDITRFALMNERIYDVVSKIYGTDIVTTIAINGYTGAGACILALASDYRAMTTAQATIGLNDTIVGIPPAMWIYELMARLTGHKHAEYALTSSFMFTAERALQIGLIDDVATDKTNAIEKCKAFIRKYDHIPSDIRAITKRSIRQDFLTQFEKDRKKYLANILAVVQSPAFQDRIDEYIQSIKRRKAAKLNK